MVDLTVNGGSLLLTSSDDDVVKIDLCDQEVSRIWSRLQLATSGAYVEKSVVYAW
jgi:hypothetical protein